MKQIFDSFNGVFAQMVCDIMTPEMIDLLKENEPPFTVDLNRETGETGASVPIDLFRRISNYTEETKVSDLDDLLLNKNDDEQTESSIAGILSAPMTTDNVS